MNTLKAGARTNLELILAEVDVLCKGIRLPQKKSRRGRKPVYSDKFILKLVIIQYLLGFTSERSFIRFLSQLEQQIFERLPDHLADIVEEFIRKYIYPDYNRPEIKKSEELEMEDLLDTLF